MSWLFGAGMGLFLGGPLGAVVGGVTQHMLTKDTRDKIMSNPAKTNQETFFVTNLAAIMTKVAMADGHVSQKETQLIHNFFANKLGYRGEELRFIDGIIQETQRLNPDLTQICHAFRMTSNPETKMLLVDITYQIASSDHVITKNEQSTIDLIASQMGLSNEDHQTIRNQYSHESKKDAYSIFGLEPGATPEEIKKAYRVMASQYHPDKVSHLGNELIEFANNKFTEINAAYDELKKIKGF
jgi:DnaJ like chaperone protein